MGFRSIAMAIVMAAVLSALAGCGTDLKISNGSATQEGVTVTLEKAAAQKKTNPSRYEYSFSGTIENNSDVGVMRVIYTFSICDKDGEEFRSFGIPYDGVNEAIPPHGAVSFSHDGIKWGAQSVPASVSIGISSVQTEDELPPAHVPQKGEYLYEALGDDKLANVKTEPPAELAFHIDQGGYGRTAVFTSENKELLDEALDLFCNIRIGEETGEMVTDNYNWISLTWKDGSKSSISLNLRNLEHYIHSEPHIFTLENLGDFWSFASDYLEEDE